MILLAGRICFILEKRSTRYASQQLVNAEHTYDVHLWSSFSIETGTTAVKLRF